MSGATQAVFMNQRSFAPPPGQQAYTAAGTYTWVCPTGVTSISVVVVGAGGGVGSNGGGLAYRNNVSVTPGASYTIVVGSGGTKTTGFNNDTSATNSSAFSCIATAGKGGTTVGTSSGVYDGGANGGLYFGGAAGYTGNGGNGATSSGASGTAGAGGGGGGASGTSSVGFPGGGGVGLLGQGTSGAAGTPGGSSLDNSAGRGGSGGQNGSGSSLGGLCGGAGAGDGSFRTGADGGVRIIWPGTTRSFPSTNTGDL